MTHFYRPAKSPKVVRTVKQKIPALYADIEHLAVTLWGYHPALWEEASTVEEKGHYRTRARNILYAMDAVPPRFGRRGEKPTTTPRQTVVIAPAKRELRKATDRR